MGRRSFLYETGSVSEFWTTANWLGFVERSPRWAVADVAFGSCARVWVDVGKL